MGEEALGVAHETGDERGGAKSLISLSAVDEAHGKLLERDLKIEQALRIARQIGYPTLIWQAAHLLARAQAG